MTILVYVDHGTNSFPWIPRHIPRHFSKRHRFQIPIVCGCQACGANGECLCQKCRMAVLTEEDDDLNQNINDSQNGCIFSFPILGKSGKTPCVHCPNFGVKNSMLAFLFHQEEIFTSDPGTFHEAPHSWEVAFHALSRWKMVKPLLLLKF